jgi:hypothetical protein
MLKVYTGNMKTEPAYAWPYIAAFLDGEGCLHAIGSGGAGKGKFRVTLSQSDDIGKRTLEKIAAFLNDQGIYAYVCAQGEKRNRKLHWKPAWNLWITQQRSVVKFIEGVLPHLEIKKQRAEDYRRMCILSQNESGLHNESQIKLRRDTLMRLMDSGKSVAEIAKMHGLDYSTVWAKAKRCGYTVDTITESNQKRALVDWETILRDFEELGQYQLVARKHGIDAGNLRKRLIRNGVTPNDPWPSKQKKAA